MPMISTYQLPVASLVIWLSQNTFGQADGGGVATLQVESDLPVITGE